MPFIGANWGEALPVYHHRLSATDPQSPAAPEQSSTLNKKQRTMTEIDLMPTEKQKTCTNPPEFIVILPDNITICNHCYGLLDENFRLIEERKIPSAEAA